MDSIFFSTNFLLFDVFIVSNNNKNENDLKESEFFVLLQSQLIMISVAKVQVNYQLNNYK